MAQAIFDYATSINVDANRTLFTSVSNSGIFRSEIGSPVFYYIEATPRLAYSDIYDVIARDVMDLEYGRTPVAIKIPHEIIRGGSEVNGIPSVSSVSQNGTQITLNGGVTGTLRKGDYIQIKHVGNPGDTDLDSAELTTQGALKVYQVAEDATLQSGGGTVVQLNTALTRGVTLNGARLRLGGQCYFKVIANDIPGVNTIPGNNAPLYLWSGSFTFREIL